MSSGTAYLFEPEFTILSTEEDPGLQLRQADMFTQYNVPTWKLTTQDQQGNAFHKLERSEAQ